MIVSILSIVFMLYCPLVSVLSRSEFQVESQQNLYVKSPLFWQVFSLFCLVWIWEVSPMKKSHHVIGLETWQIQTSYTCITKHHGGFQLLDLIIPELKSHVIPYKFKSSYWLKLQYSDWRANLVKVFFFTNKFSTNESTWIYKGSHDF